MSLEGDSSAGALGRGGKLKRSVRRILSNFYVCYRKVVHLLIQMLLQLQMRVRYPSITTRPHT